MPYDGIVLSAVAAQLNKTVLGGRIEKIYQPEHDAALLVINAQSDRFYLYISASSAHPRVTLVTETGPNPQNPMGFCMLLRKHIQGGRITRITQRGSERILEISVGTISELGFSEHKMLVVEIMGKHSNIILIDPNSKIIIDSIKRLTIDINRHRQTLPGCLYIEPPSQNKVSWNEITTEEIDVIAVDAVDAVGVSVGASKDRYVDVSHGDDPAVVGRLSNHAPMAGSVNIDPALTSGISLRLTEGIAGKIQGISKRAAEELANEVLHQVSIRQIRHEDNNKHPDYYKRLKEHDTAGIISNTAATKVDGVMEDIAQTKAYEVTAAAPAAMAAGFAELVLETTRDTLLNLIDNIKTGRFSPRVYCDNEGQPIDYHAFPLHSLEDCPDVHAFDDISQAIEYYYSNKTTTNRLRQKNAELLKITANGLGKLLLKKQRLLEDIQKAEKAETYRLYGELLTANLHSMQQGETSITVTNYYDNTNVSIPLDPKLTPSQNAQSWYKLYTKAKKTVIEKKIRLEETENDIGYLKSVETYIENNASLEEAEALRDELAEAGFIRKRRQPVVRKQVRAESWSYKLPGDFIVLAGRNNFDNDTLTFKKASPKDLWLHTKNIPGSHVILFTKGAEADEQSIFKAAAIAAWHSAARDSENVPVDYTLVKYVKKPSGAKPGMVIFTNNKTVYVNPSQP